MKIKRIHLKSSGRVNVAWAERVGDELTEKSESSPERPLPSLEKALQALDLYVLRSCRLDGGYLKDLEVRSASFSYKGEAICRFTVGATLPGDSNSPVNVHTPLRTLWSDGDSEADDQVEADVRTLVDHLMAEVERYILGERLQPDLPPAPHGEGEHDYPEDHHPDGYADDDEDPYPDDEEAA